MTQIIFADFIDIYAVIADFTVLNIVKTVDQVGDRCLAGAGASDERDFLSRCRIEIHVVQNRFFRHIAEIHIVKHDVPAKLHIVHAAVCPVGMFPRPHAGALRRLSDDAVFFPGAHQGDVALVGFFFLIEQRKDPL